MVITTQDAARWVPPKVIAILKTPLLSEEQAVSFSYCRHEGSEDNKAGGILKAKKLVRDRGKLHLFSSGVTL